MARNPGVVVLCGDSNQLPLYRKLEEKMHSDGEKLVVHILNVLQGPELVAQHVLQTVRERPLLVIATLTGKLETKEMVEAALRPVQRSGVPFALVTSPRGLCHAAPFNRLRYFTAVCWFEDKDLLEDDPASLPRGSVFLGRSNKLNDSALSLLADKIKAIFPAQIPSAAASTTAVQASL